MAMRILAATYVGHRVAWKTRAVVCHGRRGQSAHAQAGAEQCVRLQADEGDAVIAVAAVEKDEQSNQGCERGDGEGSHGGGVNIGHRERSHDSTAMFFEVEDDGLVGRARLRSRG